MEWRATFDALPMQWPIAYCQVFNRILSRTPCHHLSPSITSPLTPALFSSLPSSLNTHALSISSLYLLAPPLLLYSGHVQTVKCLCNLGADVNQTNNLGCNAMH